MSFGFFDFLRLEARLLSGAVASVSSSRFLLPPVGSGEVEGEMGSIKGTPEVPSSVSDMVMYVCDLTSRGRLCLAGNYFDVGHGKFPIDNSKSACEVAKHFALQIIIWQYT